MSYSQFLDPLTYVAKSHDASMAAGQNQNFKVHSKADALTAQSSTVFRKCSQLLVKFHSCEDITHRKQPCIVCAELPLRIAEILQHS